MYEPKKITNDFNLETKAVPHQMFPNLKSAKMMYMPTSQITSDDGNTTADSHSQSYVSPPQ
jgi:hypothetical protein